MSRSFLPDWVAKLFPRASRRSRRAARSSERPAPLAAEALEDRVAPAVRVWTGLGPDTNWATAANWQGGVVPQAEDNLVFPAAPGGSLVSTNNFGAGTRFRTITIADASYLLRESAPGVNPVTLLDGLVYSAPAGGAQVNIPISLGANPTFVSANAGATITFGAPIDIPALQTLSLDGRGSVDLEGVVSGTGGLTKYGDGTLILAANNTYQGITNVFQGAVNLRNSNALGSAAAGTVAASGTAIQLQGGITVPENIVIRDTGPGFDLTTLGAIRSLGTATNTLSGVVTMTNHAGFGVDPGGRLVSTGQVLAMPGSSDNGLSLFGGGTLELAGTADNAITGQVTVAQGTLVLNKARGGAATPMPFFGNLVIGDNRDGVGAAGAARVVLSGRDQ